MKICNFIVQLKGAVLTATKCPYNRRSAAWFPRVAPVSQGKFRAPARAGLAGTRTFGCSILCQSSAGGSVRSRVWRLSR